MPKPFEGLVVLDLSDRLSGAFAARLFGDFGASVILAEPPEGHPVRAEPPFADDKENLNGGALHAYANWNKRSQVIDDPEQLRPLIEDADVIVTTADPLSAAPYMNCLSDLRADVVHLSITAHGLNDPLSGLPGNNLTASARSGWSYMNGYQGEPPLQLPRHQSGYIGGVTGFIAAAAALHRRDHGKSPEIVDVSELEALALTGHPWAIGDIYKNLGVSYGAVGRKPRGVPGPPLWQVKDGRMSFGIWDFHHWKEAMAVMGIPEQGLREELIDRNHRHSQDISAVMSGLARSLPKLERWPVFHELAQLRCVVGVMQDIDDIYRDQQLAARNFLVEVNTAGRISKAPGAPAKLSPAPWQLTQPAPDIGEHGESIVRGSRARQQVDVESTALADGPLSGIRVLSFGQAWSGTFATEVLALLGADVVQIGALHRQDVFRRLSDKVPAGVLKEDRKQHPSNTQGHYNSINLNKREVAIDLSQEEGQALLWRLLPGFDILVDNFRPTVMPSWGITLEKLHEMRPGVIWASISGYGETGPYWDYPANGGTTEPMSGLSSIHGYEGDQGMNTAALYPDPVSGYFLAASVMAALAHRDLTGEAQRVDLSMMEALNVICGDAMIEYGITGRLPEPLGNHHPRIAPHNNYQARNGEWLALATESDEAWIQLAKYIGDPRLLDEQFATMSDRKSRESELDELIGAWVIEQDANDAEDALGSIGVSAARVRQYYDIYSGQDALFRASEFLTEVDHPEVGPSWLPGRPWRFSAAPAAAVRPAPCVGQHSHEVLVGEMGLSEDEYQSLVVKGITGTLDDQSKT